MRRVFAFCLILLACDALAQHKLHWEVVDDQGSPLIGATILVNDQILITGKEGQVGATFKRGWVHYQVSFVGFTTANDSVFHHADRVVHVRMRLRDEVMDEVFVDANNLRNQLTETSTGHEVFSIEAMTDLPYLMGERDPLKFIQSQPGVSTGTDGNNGYYVRGGGIDQNKIELDQIELYNTNHLFGFFSMFNAEAVDRVDYYKSGYPAYIGGRLSSTMQIHTVDPSLNQFSGSLNIGLLSASLNFETPVVKGKSGLLVSVRRSYLDLITQNLLPEASNVRRRTDYRFSDYILKYYQKIGKNHVVSITGFGGRDDYFYSSAGLFSNSILWQTHNLGFNWKYFINPDTDLEFYANAGIYEQHFGGQVSVYEMDLRSDIGHWKSGLRLVHEAGDHVFTMGAEVVQRGIVPNQASLSLNDENFNLSEAPKIPSLEGAVYLDDEFSVSERLTLGLGLRLSGYAQMGPFDRYQGAEDDASGDTLHFDNNEIVCHYLRLEPRLRLSYLIDQRRSMRFSYDRSNQYIHLSPLSSVSLPSDIWVPSSAKVKPQVADQFTLGYHQIIESKSIKWSSSVYYKHLGNQVEYRNGAIAGYSTGDNYDDDFIFGKGRSYGLELSAEKEIGKFRYQLSYTLSKTERSFSEVQNGVYFPAKYDRTHDLNAVGSFRYERWVFSGLFKLASGNALTLPTAKYLIDGHVVSEYSKRNAFRMPVYHRLDLAAALTAGKKGRATWVFSVYNIYNRSNPYYVYFDVQGSANDYALDIDLKKVSLFPILPSISYELKF